MIGLWGTIPDEKDDCGKRAWNTSRYKQNYRWSGYQEELSDDSKGIRNKIIIQM